MSKLTLDAEITRQRLRVSGVVQGVGFRPYVYNLARSLNLVGFVGNDTSGVFIEVEGMNRDVDAFVACLPEQSPPLARVDAVLRDVLMPVYDEDGFVIITSQGDGRGATLVAPDVGLCDDCLRELFDKENRRFRYPFINCTNCGPRFTIIRQLPYDRPATTMSEFTLCSACQQEYDDPRDRRFHAQPNACRECGPHLIWYGDNRATHEEALQNARQVLKQGGIVAVKGIGGYHLACDATNVIAVEHLRQRKQRPVKPFAVMVADIAQAHALAQLNQQEAHLLKSQQRPIVLVDKRPGVDLLAHNIAPGVAWLGLFLPYTPLHHLLLQDMPPLVMTSANISGEPIITEDDIVQMKLGHVVDGFLMHNRPIHIHCDDSVMRVMDDTIIPLRRSRGYAPYPVSLPDGLGALPLLAIGAEIKNTFCLVRGEKAFMSQHIGDMASLSTLETLERTVYHFLDVFDTRPESIVVDAHPAYFSSRIGARLSQQWQIPMTRVQHHHAHIASVMAEHGVPTSEPVIGICWDGTGYGDDGAIWGGEFLVADYASNKRFAHLAYAPLLGGDASVHHPYRVALSQLWAHGISWDDDLAPVQRASNEEKRIFRQQLVRAINTTPTSSMGRLFDAVASLLGLCHDSHYEAHAPMLLETICESADLIYRFDLHINTMPYQLDPTPVLKGIVADMRQKIDTAIIIGRFHSALVDVARRVVRQVSHVTSIERVALSGGVFQNRFLLLALKSALAQDGFDVLCHQHVPPNDGGLALGQAIIGCASVLTKTR